MSTYTGSVYTMYIICIYCVYYMVTIKCAFFLVLLYDKQFKNTLLKLNI